MNRTVGTCGACGGRVSVPSVPLGEHLPQPPVPACESCGRRVARPWGPVVEMAESVAGTPAWASGAWRRDRRQGQDGGESAEGEEAGSPVHDNYREHDYFKARRGGDK